jgi:pimeloyl-ACP methyl ester carboxylesterase
LEGDLVSGQIAGPLLVLLPAFPLDRSLWSDVVAHLEGTVPILALDLPGLGESACPEAEPDLDLAADAVVACLDRLGRSRAVVAGVSLGGYVTLALARRHQDRLAGIALIDTRPDADTAQARDTRLRLAQAVLSPVGTRALSPMVATLLGSTSHRERPGLVHRVGGLLAHAPARGVAWSQRAMARRGDSWGLLPDLNLPAAVVVGAQDEISPPEVARRMAAALPDAVLTVVDGAGHLSPLEAPHQVADALTALMLRVAPR